MSYTVFPSELTHTNPRRPDYLELDHATSPPADRSSGERIIGRLRSGTPGPMLVAVGSMHGNEPAGVLALEQVVERLQSESLLVRGDLLALVGNLSAIRSGQRFIDEDLNRQWSPERLARLASLESGSTAEDHEQRALLEEIHVGFASARGPITLLDLHTTSGEGHPFAVFTDTMRSRHFARRFPVPAVLGLEESLVGTLVDYVGLLGHVAVGFEGGQHLDPRSVSNLASIAWMALAELGAVDAGRCTWIEELRGDLRRSTRAVPRTLSVVYRHPVFGVYADSCGLKTAFLGNGGRKAATIFSLRYSSSR